MKLSRRHAGLSLLSLAVWLALPAHAADVALATVAVQAAGGSGRQSYDGVVEAVRQTGVSAQVAGAIVALNVRVGDSVKAGQELVRIDARAATQNANAASAQVDAARAALQLANAEAARQQQLFAKQYISQAALDRAQAQAQAAQAQVQALAAQTSAAQTQSQFFVLKAPYSGVVSEVLVALGDMAMPGRPLLTVYDPSALRVTATLPQAAAADAGALQQLRLELPALMGADAGLQTPASVRLLPVLDAATHSAQVQAALPAGFKSSAPGMFARVWLPASARQEGGPERFSIPASAVVRRAELTAVYSVDDKGKPSLRQVRLGAQTGDRVEVLSGLQKGALIALDPQAAAKVR